MDFKLSIITVCLNAEKHLCRCIESIKTQSFDDLEHLIVDGGSTDNTIEIIQSHKHPKLKWISKKDDGIADAMNKGIQMASGEWLLFINSDDYLPNPSTLKIAFQDIEKKGAQSCIWLFPVILTGGNRPEQLITVKISRLWRKIPACHQGMVFHRSVFQKSGNYDSRFKICMDYEFLMRASKNDVSIYSADTVICNFDNSGISSSRIWNNEKLRLEEERQVHLYYSETAICKWFYKVYWALYFPYRRILNLFH